MVVEYICQRKVKTHTQTTSFGRKKHTPQQPPTRRGSPPDLGDYVCVGARGREMPDHPHAHTLMSHIRTFLRLLFYEVGVIVRVVAGL